MENISALQQQWVKEYKQTNNIEVRDNLILSLEPIIRTIASQYKGFPIDQHDMYLTGIEAVMTGIEKYDVNSSTKLSSYLYRIIENRIIHDVRKSTAKKRTGNTVSLEFTIHEGANDDKDIKMKDKALIFDPQIEEMTVLRYDLVEAVDSLPNNLREVVKLRFGLTGKDPLAQKDIAAVVGVHHSTITRWETKALNMLKNYLGNYKEV